MRYIYIILSIFISLVPNQVASLGIWLGNINPGGVITPEVISPVAGQSIQGAVVIRGSTAVDGFKSYEVDFTHTKDSTRTWILIQESGDPIQDGILAVWDTSSITDDEYDLRLIVFKTDGSSIEVPVLGLKVINDISLNTDKPSPTVMYVTLGPSTPTYTSAPQDTLTPSETPLPSTPTPLPANPVEITTPQVMSTFGKGAALSIGLLVLFGAYVGVRAFLNRQK
jgi:hypothetical protein